MAEVKSKIPGSCHSGLYNPMTSKIARTFSNTRLWGLKFRSTCGRSFYSPNTLDFHLQRKHKSSNIVELFCSLCYVSFPKRSGLKKHNDILHRAHKNNIHTSEKEIAAFNAKIEMSPLAHKCKLCRKKKKFLIEKHQEPSPYVSAQTFIQDTHWKPGDITRFTSACSGRLGLNFGE